jgi:PTH1 family peptidyl-tRNA hydrolase
MGQGRFGNTSLVLAKPMTFMNLSGDAVCGLISYNNIETQHLIVLHDEVDFLLGTLRIKTGGGAGGHKGIKSIIDRLGKSDFIRVRIGVGRPQEGNLADYVLSRFEQDEKDQVEKVVTEAVTAICSILEVGVDEARKQLHTPG